ncbi:MAG TPA: hypothetical protein VGI39_41630 [Polyangiaceae bacterium]
MNHLLAPLLLLLLSGVACSKPSGSAPAPAATCTKVNDPCQYADGKIGLCNPTSLECDGGPSCLTCMSLH